jgi:hypothetical protein
VERATEIIFQRDEISRPCTRTSIWRLVIPALKMMAVSCPPRGLLVR